MELLISDLMNELPMAYPSHDKPGYSHPPRYSEGAQKAMITRDVIGYDGTVLLKKGTTGVVITFAQRPLYHLFEQHNNWINKGLYWSNGFGTARLDRTYDFFHHYEKDGKKIVGTWHTYVSFFDFEYTY